MHAKQIVGGVFAMGLAGLGMLAFAGQDKIAGPDNPLCTNGRLAYPAQAACAREMQGAATPDQQAAVTQKYRDMINAAFKDKQTANRGSETKTN
jgi:hypothetical protein